MAFKRSHAGLISGFCGAALAETLPIFTAGLPRLALWAAGCCEGCTSLSEGEGAITTLPRPPFFASTCEGMVVILLGLTSMGPVLRFALRFSHEPMSGAP